MDQRVKIELETLPDPDDDDDIVDAIIEDDVDLADIPLVRAEILRSTGRMALATYVLMGIFLGSRGWLIVPKTEPAWPWHVVWAGIFAGVFLGFVGWVGWAFRRAIKLMGLDDLEREKLRVLRRRAEIAELELRELDEEYVTIQKAEREQRNFEAREKLRLRRERAARKAADDQRNRVLAAQNEIEADLRD